MTGRGRIEGDDEQRSDVKGRTDGRTTSHRRQCLWTTGENRHLWSALESAHSNNFDDNLNAVVATFDADDDEHAREYNANVGASDGPINGASGSLLSSSSPSL